MDSKNFYPESPAELKDLLLEAHKQNAHVQPYAGGYNWGYGETDVTTPNTWKVYFDKMKKIISFDPVFGVVRIQPGVTQGDLEKYLSDNNLNYYVPNTGAGSRGSLLGNALERGFGIAPMQDHASSLLAIRGYFADGSPYNSSLLEVDRTLAECFPWGVGPQLDFLVSQNSWIFIYEVSIQLVPKFPHTDLLVMNFLGSQISSTADCLRKIMQTHPGIIGSIKMFHKNQILTAKSYSAASLRKDWFLIITVYSNSETRKANLRSVKKILKDNLSGPVLRFNRRRIDSLMKILNLFRIPLLEQFRTSIFDLSEFLRLGEGFTTEVGYKALDPKYNPELKQSFGMDQLSKRLVWFSPICPLQASNVEKLLSIISIEKQKAPCEFRTMTWTVLNSKTIALVIPLLFERSQEKEFWIFYKELHRTLKLHGFIPYRFHVNMMPFLTQELMPKHFALTQTFKSFLDPKNILIADKY